MSDNTASQSNDELNKVDHEIEEDIKHLKRSSNFLAVLGLLVIVIFLVLFSFKFLQSFSGEGPELAPKFIDVGVVTVDQSAVFEQPMPTANSIGMLEHDSAVFILVDNIEGWYKIQAPIIINGQNTGNELKGWIRKADVRSRSEIKAMRKALSERVEKSIDIIDVKWTIDEVGNYTISGKVVNLTDVPLRNIKVLITFYDDQNRRVDQRTTFVATDSNLRRNRPVPFAFIGKNEKTFTFVNCRVDYSIEED